MFCLILRAASIPNRVQTMTTSIPPLQATPSAPMPSPQGWPLLRLGFRPFYLGAAAYAMLAVPLWIALLLGQVSLKLTVSPLLWHAHEMLFGFAVAVIVGFLLTAGKAWTGLATPRGAVLGALAGLWLAARLAAVFAPYAIYAALDLLLLPLVAAILITVLLRAGNRRNLPLGGILLLLTAANAAFHAAVLGVIDIAPVRALHAGLALVVMIECVIAGRVIPAFTMSALPGVKLQAPPALETATLAATALGPGAVGTGAAECLHRRRARCRRIAARPAAVALAAAAHACAPHPLGTARGLCLAAGRPGTAGSGNARCGGCVGRYPRAGCGRHGWAHHRHDHPHRTRPHRSAAAGVTAGSGRLPAGGRRRGGTGGAAAAGATASRDLVGCSCRRLGAGVRPLSFCLRALVARDPPRRKGRLSADFAAPRFTRQFPRARRASSPAISSHRHIER